MKLYRSTEVPVRMDDIVCKESPWVAGIKVFVAIGFMSLLLIAPVVYIARGVKDFNPTMIVGIVLAPIAIVGIVGASRGFLKTLREPNWTMRWNEESLIIKFSSFLNKRLRKEEDIVAVGFSFNEIEWIAHRPIKILLPREIDAEKFRAHYLDIKLRDGNLKPLQQAMNEEEARPKSWHANSSNTWYVEFYSMSHKSCVYVIDHDIIRLAWRVPGKYLAPGIKQVIQALSDKIAIRPQVDEQTDLADQKKMQEILLREWAQAGQARRTEDAIVVAKEFYRVSQSEAERIVKDLKKADKQPQSIS